VATDGAVWGICMARDEADIIAATVAHMATQVDHVLVADNLSKDDTARLAVDAGAQVVPDSEPAYWQSDKMTGLAAVARSRGAAWVVPFDADEIWHTRSGQRIGDYLAGVDAHVAIADLFDHWTTDADVLDEPDPTRRMTWRSALSGALPKVACRTALDLTIHMGNHSATYEHPTGHARGELVVRHFPYRSPEQFVRKARQGGAALARTGLHRSIGAHWRQYARTLEQHGEGALAAHYWDAFHYRDPVAAGLVCDPPPVRP